jgi:serine/threonine-protein kinase
LPKVTLTGLSGDIEHQVFVLEGKPVFIFGRHEKVHINLGSDPLISQIHFLVDVSDDFPRVVDLGSTNGLAVNERLYGGRFGKPPEFVHLKDGDIITAGNTLIKINFQASESGDGKTSESNRQKHMGFPSPQRSSSNTVRIAHDIPAGLAAPSDRPPVPQVKEKKEGNDPSATTLYPGMSDYTIQKCVHTGNKGLVYRAINNETGVLTAIKILLPESVKRPRIVEGFLHEIELSRHLEHPHLIHYLGDGMVDGSPYLAMEFLNGGNLHEYLDKLPEQRMPLEEAIPLICHVASATSYMQSRQLVHKDIKPKNIILEQQSDGKLIAKLSDFGLTSHISRPGDRKIPPMAIGGTPAYMPPEQLVDVANSIPQSDVFSIAATLYQMLSGHLLYDFTGPDQISVILDGNIIPILDHCPELPGRVAETINKALSYQPEQRFANAGELLLALRELI